MSDDRGRIRASLLRGCQTREAGGDFRPPSSDIRHPSFAGLVVVAGSQYPIPSRTRPLNSPAPMVLSLKTWKSRSLPGLQRTEASSHHDNQCVERRSSPKSKPSRILSAAAFLYSHVHASFAHAHHSHYSKIEKSPDGDFTY